MGNGMEGGTLAFLIQMAPNLATELTVWLGAKSKGGLIEQALRRTEEDLKAKFNLDVYEALAWWCRSPQFKILLETVSTSPQGSFDDLERAFIEHTKLSSEQAKQVVSVFVLHLKDAIFTEHPSLTDSRSKVRDDEILKTLLASEAKADANNELLMGKISEMMKEISELRSSGPAETETAKVKNPTPEPVSGGNEDWIPDYWQKETFTRFLAGCDSNVKAACAGFPLYADKLKRLHYLSETLNSFLGKRGQIFENLFFFRAHSSVLAAARIGLGGQIAESYTLLQAALHETLLGLYMFKNPKEMAIYSFQHNNPSNSERARGRYTLSKMRAFLKSENVWLSGVLRHLLNNMVLGDITQGSGLASVLEIGPDGQWTIVYSHYKEIRYLATMKTIAQVQVFRLVVAGLVYPDFLNVKGIQEEIEEISKGL